MDHSKVVKQAWHNVLHYRALWVFGVILAITTMSWGTVLMSDGNDNEDAPRVGMTVTVQPGENFLEAIERTVDEEFEEARVAITRANGNLDRFFAKELDVAIESDILAVIGVVLGILLAAYIVAKIGRYVAEVSLIRMVDEQDESGRQFGVGQGLRMGWSRGAWRLFLIDLVINTPLALGFILLFALALSPLLLWAQDRLVAGVVGTVFAGGLFFVVITLAVLVAVGLSFLKPVFRRVCVLEDRGAVASIGRGWNVVRGHPTDLGLTWFIAVAVTLVLPILVIPIVLVLIAAAVLLGGASALLAGAATALAFSGVVPWIAAATAGIAIFMLVLLTPLAFLGGLREVFLSSLWTLSYRGLQPSESVESLKAPRLDGPGLEAASPA